MFQEMIYLAYSVKNRQKLVYLSLIGSLINHAFKINLGPVADLLISEIDRLELFNPQVAQVEMLENANPEAIAWAKKFEQPGRLQQYLFFTTMMRMMRPYKILVMPGESILEGARKKDSIHRLRDYDYLPTTASFRRHLVGGTAAAPCRMDRRRDGHVCRGACMKPADRQIHRDIARRFSAAAENYDSQSALQRGIAAKLVAAIPDGARPEIVLIPASGETGAERLGTTRQVIRGPGRLPGRDLCIRRTPASAATP